MKRKSSRKSHCRKLFLAFPVLLIIGIAEILLDLCYIPSTLKWISIVVTLSLFYAGFLLLGIWDIYNTICDKGKQHSANTYRDEMVQKIELSEKQIMLIAGILIILGLIQGFEIAIVLGLKTYL